MPIPTTAGTRVSINIWASASVQSGTATLGGIFIDAVWFSTTDYLAESVIGTLSSGGGAVSVKSLQPPPGAVKVRVRARLALPSWAAGANIRLYADALAVTVP